MSHIVVFLAEYLYLFVIAGAVFAVMRERAQRRRDMVILIAVTLPLAFLAAAGTGLFIEHPRPYMTDGVEPLISAAPENNSFPSSHALLTMTIAATVFLYKKKTGILLFILAIAVGVGRVLAHVHYPVDVVGSALIAVFVTGLVWLSFALYVRNRR